MSGFIPSVESFAKVSSLPFACLDMVFIVRRVKGLLATAATVGTVGTADVTSNFGLFF